MMFLKTVANPYADGQQTSALLYKPREGQTFAINAEKLHANPGLLNAFGTWRGPLIRALDALAFGCLALGIFVAVKVAWWLFLPCFAANIAMLVINRKTAGRMARKAARASNENFLYLHQHKAIWLVPDRIAA
ncbi:MAG: hypothetical protein ABJG15_07975 [Hyphomonadaceae bacterium]